MANQELRQEEVWDDSALVNSWNEALAEYKKYHSLAAKGEKVEIVLDEAVTEDLNGDSAEVHEEYHQEPGVNGLATQAKSGGASDPRSTPSKGPASSQARAASAMPQALLGGVQDEGMKNLMMSWYYAGYYTGLYEGQQKAYVEMQQG